MSGNRIAFQDPLAFLAGGGEMGERTRAFDWSKTPVGPVAGWPQSLKIAVRIMLDSRYAMWLGWGPDFTFFYNDAYARMTLGPKHPWALGRSAREVWSEIWDDIGPRAESVVRTGQATWDEGLLLFLERRGFPEETYHTFSYSPVPDDQGGVGGMLCVVTEDTERTIGERRLRTLRELAARTTERGEVRRGRLPDRRPHAGREPARPALRPPLPARRRRQDRSPGRGHGPAGRPRPPRPGASIWPLRTANSPGGRCVPCWSQAVPRSSRTWGSGSARCPAACGLSHRSGPSSCRWRSPARPDSPGSSWPGSAPGWCSTTTTGASSTCWPARSPPPSPTPGPTRRSGSGPRRWPNWTGPRPPSSRNVSHEFRTPLTLMLGPVEDALAEPDGELPPTAAGAAGGRPPQRAAAPAARQHAAGLLPHRGRAGAGVLRADRPRRLHRRPRQQLPLGVREGRAGTDGRLPAAWRSRCSWTGRCGRRSSSTSLSNAFKFTFEGGIAVTVRQAGRVGGLAGAGHRHGHPAEEMPRLFERFHRVENARGRTHEGSGIGLALVQELVRLHGGSITAESEVGRGTTFIVTVPLGSAHLPPDQVGGSRTAASTDDGGQSVRRGGAALAARRPGRPRRPLRIAGLREDDPPAPGPHVPAARRRPAPCAGGRRQRRHAAVRRAPAGRSVHGRGRAGRRGGAGGGAPAAARPDPVRRDDAPAGRLRAAAGTPGRPPHGQRAGHPAVGPCGRGEPGRGRAGRGRRLPGEAVQCQGAAGPCVGAPADGPAAAGGRASRCGPSEERFRTLFESMDEAFCVVEMLYDADDRPVDYRFLEANPTFEQAHRVHRRRGPDDPGVGPGPRRPLVRDLRAGGGDRRADPVRERGEGDGPLVRRVRLPGRRAGQSQGRHPVHRHHRPQAGRGSDPQAVGAASPTGRGRHPVERRPRRRLDHRGRHRGGPHAHRVAPGGHGLHDRPELGAGDQHRLAVREVRPLAGLRREAGRVGHLLAGLPHERAAAHDAGRVGGAPGLQTVRHARPPITRRCGAGSPPRWSGGTGETSA